MAMQMPSTAPAAAAQGDPLERARAAIDQAISIHQTHMQANPTAPGSDDEMALLTAARDALAEHAASMGQEEGAEPMGGGGNDMMMRQMMNQRMRGGR